MRTTNIASILVFGSVLFGVACGGTPSSSAPAPAATRPLSVSQSTPTQLAAPVARPTSVEAATPARPDVVRVSRSLGLGNVLQIAVTRGYLEEQGIDFREETFGSSADAMPALASGDLDGGSTTPNASLFNAFARGIRLTLALGASEFAADGNGMPLVSRVGPQGPAISDIAGLRGKRLALTQRGVISELALDRLLGSAGLRQDDLEITLMPFPDQVAALGAGRLDAAVLVEPFATLAEQRGLATRMVNTDRYIPGSQNAVMTYLLNKPG